MYVIILFCNVFKLLRFFIDNLKEYDDCFPGTPLWVRAWSYVSRWLASNLESIVRAVWPLYKCWSNAHSGHFTRCAPTGTTQATTVTETPATGAIGAARAATLCLFETLNQGFLFHRKINGQWLRLHRELLWKPSTLPSLTQTVWGETKVYKDNIFTKRVSEMVTQSVSGKEPNVLRIFYL